MQTHVDGAIVVPADSLVRARPVIGLLVHFDGDRIAGYAFPTSSNSDMQSYKAMTIQNLRMTWQMPLLGVALALQAMSCHKHASASVYWNNMNGIHTLVDTLVTGRVTQRQTHAGRALVDTVDPHLLERRVGGDRRDERRGSDELCEHPCRCW